MKFSRPSLNAWTSRESTLATHDQNAPFELKKHILPLSGSLPPQSLCLCLRLVFLFSLSLFLSGSRVDFDLHCPESRRFFIESCRERKRRSREQREEGRKRTYIAVYFPHDRVEHFSLVGTGIDFEVFQESRGDSYESIFRPWQKPVDCRAKQGRKLLSSLCKNRQETRKEKKRNTVERKSRSTNRTIALPCEESNTEEEEKEREERKLAKQRGIGQNSRLDITPSRN